MESKSSAPFRSLAFVATAFVAYLLFADQGLAASQNRGQGPRGCVSDEAAGGLSKSFDRLLRILPKQNTSSASVLFSTAPFVNHGHRYLDHADLKVFSPNSREPMVLSPVRSETWNSFVEEALRAVLCTPTGQEIVEQVLLNDPELVTAVTGLEPSRARSITSRERTQVPRITDPSLEASRRRILSQNPRAWAILHTASGQQTRDLFDVVQSFTYNSNLTILSPSADELTLANLMASLTHEIFVRIDSKWTLSADVNAGINAVMSRLEQQGHTVRWPSGTGSARTAGSSLFSEDLILNQSLLSIRALLLEKRILSEIGLSTSGKLRELHTLAERAEGDTLTCYRLARAIGISLLPVSDFFAGLFVVQLSAKPHFGKTASARDYINRFHIPALLSESAERYDARVIDRLVLETSNMTLPTKRDFSNFFALSLQAMEEASNIESYCQNAVRPEFSILGGLRSTGPRPRLSGGGD